MDCCAFCHAVSYKLKPLKEALQTQYKTISYRDVLHVEILVEEQLCDFFFFDYGSMVCWGISKDRAAQFLELAKPFIGSLCEEMDTDEFTYIVDTIPKIADDEIILPNTDPLTKLAISHGIAQSVKLGTFEIAIQKTFALTKQLPEDLARFGKISLSRNQIRRKMGQLFIDRNSINLHLDVLDQPEFFWEYPELEFLYTLTANYLDLANRVQVLNQRLGIVHELFEMLGNELNHQHSSRLEWTVICLIVIEVLLTIFRDH